MPPFNKTVRQRCIEDLVETLKTIQGGDDYYTVIKSVHLVRTNQGIVDPVKPCAIVFLGEEDIRDGAVDQREADQHFTIQVGVYEDSDPALAVRNLCDDIEKKLRATYQRGQFAESPNAFDTQITRKLFGAAVLGMPFDVGQIDGYIRFRYSDRDPTVAN